MASDGDCVVMGVAAGSVLAWNGNTVHWGTRCSSHVKQPRISFSVAFRRRSAQTYPLATPLFPFSMRLPVLRSLAAACVCALCRSHLESSVLQSMTPDDTLRLTLSERVRLIAKGLLLFKWWFGVDSEVLPKLFFEKLHSL